MITILYVTVLTISALYVPQPLLPTLAREFAVSRETAALMTTVAFAPLGLAPLFYGYLLESISPLRLIRGAVLLLLLSEIPFLISDSFALLLVMRFLQGLLIPGLLTALMTYVSSTAPAGEVTRSMSIYIAATIMGGFLGRFISALIADTFHWRWSFAALATSLAIALIPMARIKVEFTLPTVKPTRRLLLDTFLAPTFNRVYLAAFFMFFVFAAIMNFIPFRLVELRGDEAKGLIGWLYSGYLMGIVSALLSVRIANLVGGEYRAMAAAFIVYIIATGLLSFESIPALLAVMFLFCASMFLIHTTASGFLNRMAEQNRGVVNGLYVASYYGGGTLGSVLPGFMYEAHGWSGFLWLLAGASLIGFFCIGLVRRPA